MDTNASVADRSLQTQFTLEAPLDLVWRVWTEPDHVARWWGPRGFTNTIHVMDLQAGGEWRLTMHGPDGKNFANRSIFREVVPQQKLVFEHFNPHFVTTVLFQSVGTQTQVDWTMVFETVELYDVVVKVHQADKGQAENVEKLREYLADLQENS